MSRPHIGLRSMTREQLNIGVVIARNEYRMVQTLCCNHNIGSRVARSRSAFSPGDNVRVSLDDDGSKLNRLKAAKICKSWYKIILCQRLESQIFVLDSANNSVKFRWIFSLIFEIFKFHHGFVM